MGPVSPLDGGRDVSAETPAQAGCNPLAGLDPNSLMVFEHTAAIAGVLVNGDGPWEESARDLGTAYLLLLARVRKKGGSNG